MCGELVMNNTALILNFFFFDPNVLCTAALKIQTKIPQAFNSMGEEELKKNVNVNFASGGCGLLAKTHPTVPIPVRILVQCSYND